MPAVKKKSTKFGWRPDLPDQRDWVYGSKKKAALPSKVDLTPFCPPVYHQGALSSCTAHAIAAAFQFGQMKQSVKKPFMPSRLFIYYNERVLEGTVNEDSGAQLRDGIKTIHKQGVCPESLWPYAVTKFKQKPYAKAYKAALENQLLSYSRVKRKLVDFKRCLAEGYPFIFGFAVYESFEGDKVAKSGRLNMPGKKKYKREAMR